MKLVVQGYSHVGRVRTKNDDAFLIDHQVGQSGPIECVVEQLPALIAIADGMGGYDGGEVASTSLLEALAPISGEDLYDAALQAHRHMQARTTQMYPDSGTTLAGIQFVDEKTAKIFHVGDSRVYRESAGYLRQLTVDHTPAGPLLASGALTLEEATRMPNAHHLARSFDASGPSPDLEVTSIDVDLGDRFFLATDGFAGIGSGLSEHEIENSLNLNAEQFVHKAVELDGKDNTTVVIITVVES